MSWQVAITRSAQKFLKRIAEKDATKIKAALREMVENPYGGDIRKMKGEENVWRRRVGVYRIFFEISEKECSVSVYGIERRTSKTY